ncbi:MAG: cell division protein ZapA [Myxococcota bacterium]
MAKRTLDLELFGQRFSVSTDTEEKRVREIVGFVNQRLEAIRDGSRRVHTDQIALLAALNIAEELFDERDEHDAVRRGIRERAHNLLHRIDVAAQAVDAGDREAANS